MRQIIVHSPTFMTLLGGSPADFGALERALRLAPILVAADGGADAALRTGHIPDAVIGDMDSISPSARSQIPTHQQHVISEQDSTDFEKCLRHIKARVILAVGFLGGRLDHQLAACTALVRHPEQKCILIGEEDLCFLAPAAFALELPQHTRFSLYPMALTGGKSVGLKYPIDDLAMSPATRVGTSNEVIGPVALELDDRKMLVLLPVEHLEAVIEMLDRTLCG